MAGGCRDSVGRTWVLPSGAREGAGGVGVRASSVLLAPHPWAEW